MSPEMPGLASPKRRVAGDALRQAFGVLIDGGPPGAGYSGWAQAAADGKPLNHGGEAGAALGMAEEMVAGRGLRAGDETGSVGIGPMGLEISKSGENGWEASLAPEGASFSKGDVSVSGTWGDGWSGEIGLGPVRIGGGYGMAPTPTQPGYAQLDRNWRTVDGAMEQKPSYWGQVGVKLGGQPQKPSGLPPSMRPTATTEGEPAVSPARQALEEQVRLYRQSNGNWWRPD